MQIYNTTTGETVDLNYYDRRVDVAQQQDSAIDLCGSDPDIVYNQEEDRYEASQDCIDYWTAWLKAVEHCDDLEREIKEKLIELGEDDPDTLIDDRVYDRYFDHDQWPTQRYELLTALKREVFDDLAPYINRYH